MFLTVNDDGTTTFETADYTFTAIKGMEGPMLYRVGGVDRVLHYCAKEGKYYQQDVDMFMDVDTLV